VTVKRGGAAIAILLLLLLALPIAASARDTAPASASKWTATDPPINFAHIETGEINRRGEAVGYHHRPNGIDPPGARVLRVTQPPDANGVYRARVALRDPATGEWIDKRASSTCFPDAMSDDEVILAVLAAFHNGQRHRGGEFVGASGHGFMIEGWYQSGRIVAAYPLRGP
jgi:EndoU nuclease-like protein